MLLASLESCSVNNKRVKQLASQLTGHPYFFFLEYSGELHIFVLRRRKDPNTETTRKDPNTETTTPLGSERGVGVIVLLGLLQSN